MTLSPGSQKVKLYTVAGQGPLVPRAKLPNCAPPPSGGGEGSRVGLIVMQVACCTECMLHMSLIAYTVYPAVKYGANYDGERMSRQQCEEQCWCHWKEEIPLH